MSALLLARIQFAFTVCFHFLFPAMTLGTSLIILASETFYLIKKDATYKKITDFLVKLLGLIFVMGVASGIVMEFSFGTNWSEYSRAVGDIFGPVLAAEGVIAFFLESVFLGVLLFGRDRVSPKLYWLSAVLVFCGGLASAYWIIVANSWMQTPAGYTINEAGRIELSSFFDAVFNPSTQIRFYHTVVASWITGAVMIAGISGYYLRKGLHSESAKAMLKISMVIFIVGPFVQLATGHVHAIEVMDRQPEKAAAFEGHFNTTRGAPLYAFGYVDEQNEKTYGLYMPKALSFLYNFDWNSEIKGLNDFPRENWPPVNLVFQVYHIMVAVGLLLIALGLFGGYLLWTGKIYEHKAYLSILPFLIPLPHIAHETGWMAAEIGRQPWIIYQVMRTSNAASTVVTRGEIFFSLLMFFLIYLLLTAVFVKIFINIVQKGPAE